MRGHSLHVRLPLPLTPTASWGVPKPLWVWMVSYKDSQNSPKAAILTVMVYYKERVQIKMSSKEKIPGTESSSVPSAGFFHPLSIESGLVILLVLMCNNTECCQPEGLTQASAFRVFTGAPWLIDRSSGLNSLFFYHKPFSFLLYSLCRDNYSCLDCFRSYLGEGTYFCLSSWIRRKPLLHFWHPSLHLLPLHWRTNLLSRLSELDIDWGHFTRWGGGVIVLKVSAQRWCTLWPSLVLPIARNWTNQTGSVSGGLAISKLSILPEAGWNWWTSHPSSCSYLGRVQRSRERV